MGNKAYAAPTNYETKLKRVMERLGVTEYDYDWTRRGCWVAFRYKGSWYRFEHSIDSAAQHGVKLQYGSDAFAQVVLSLEDLARMVERGIYDLSVWVSGMKYLPAGERLEPCFLALGFTSRPKTEKELHDRFRLMAKTMHPDTGGDREAFEALSRNYELCKSLLRGAVNSEV